MVALEAIFLLLPTFVYWAFIMITWLILSIHWSGESHDPDLGPGWLLFVFSGTALIACIRITIAYLSGGLGRLRTVDRIWWGICGGGVALVLIGAIVTALPLDTFMLQVRPAAYGLPALIIFFHLFGLRVANHPAG